VRLPAGAIITGAAWRVYDNSASGEIGSCVLERHFQSGSNVMATETLASTDPSGVATTSADILNLSDGIIAGREVVDNATYDYVSRCTVVGTNSLTGMYRFEVDYTVAGLPVV